MLVTLADMKTYLGIVDNSYDAFLTEQLNLISDTVEAYCRRKFEQASYVQTWYRDEFQGIPPKDLLAFHFPIISVTDLKVDTVLEDSTNYRIHRPTGTLKLLSTFSTYSWKELEFTYSAGYTDIPTPITNVVTALVEERYNKKISGVALNFGSDVQRVSIPGTISIDFDYTLTANDRISAFGSILGNNLNVLDYYRSERQFGAIKELEYVS